MCMSPKLTAEEVTRSLVGLCSQVGAHGAVLVIIDYHSTRCSAFAAPGFETHITELKQAMDVALEAGGSELVKETQGEVLDGKIVLSSPASGIVH